MNYETYRIYQEFCWPLMEMESNDEQVFDSREHLANYLEEYVTNCIAQGPLSDEEKAIALDELVEVDFWGISLHGADFDLYPAEVTK